MGTSARRSRSDRLIDSIIALCLKAPDAAFVLDSKEDKQCLSTTVSIAVECDDLMRRGGDRLWEPSGRDIADEICRKVTANIDTLHKFKFTFVDIWHTPLKRPRGTVTVRGAVAEHRRLMKRLREKSMDLEKRVGVLLQLMQLEVIFVGYMW